MKARDANADEVSVPQERKGLLLDDLLPHYDFRERHSRLIAAPPRAVWEAVERVTLGEMPFVGALFALRSLPARLAGRPGLPQLEHEPILAQLPASGFARLAETAERELVFGVIAQMWKRGGETAEISDGAAFVAFGRTGFVKAAMNFRLCHHPAGTRLETETRMLATDAGARRGFGRYWLLIRPASGLIRQIWLRAIARRATQASDPPR